MLYLDMICFTKKCKTCIYFIPAFAGTGNDFCFFYFSVDVTKWQIFNLQVLVFFI
jgi:hypothetical protein